jgi:thiamine pyrophosphokinase
MKDKTVSFLPFGGEAHIGKSGGLYYPPDGLTLAYGSCRTLSNVIVADEAYFDVAFGTALVFIGEEIKSK